LLDRAHIRIDSLYILFPQKLRLALDLLALVLFTSFFALTLWHGFGVVGQSWTSGSRSQSALETPTIIPQFLWIAGLVAFVGIAIVILVQSLRLAVAGDLPGMAQLISTRSAQEDVEDEIRDFKGRQGRDGRP